MKTCRTCKAEKPLHSFHRAGERWHRGECKQCRSAYMRRLYRAAIMNTPRVSRGLATPGKVMTERGVRRPVALSVASSTGTPGITGAACGAETRYHERRADPHGESGNAGAVGQGPIYP